MQAMTRDDSDLGDFWCEARPPARSVGMELAVAHVNTA